MALETYQIFIIILAPGRTKRGVSCVGRQIRVDGGLDNIWILNPNERGEQIPLESSPYNNMWQPIGGPCIETGHGKGSNCGKIDIRSTVMLPLESKIALKCLLGNMKCILKHNFIAGKEVTHIRTITL